MYCAINRLSFSLELLGGFYFKETVTPEPGDLVAKGLTPSQSADVARRSYALLLALPDLCLVTAEPPMRELVEQMRLSAGQVFGILRVAVTDQKVSPPLFESMEVIGRDKVLERIQHASFPWTKWARAKKNRRITLDKAI